MSMKRIFALIAGLLLCAPGAAVFAAPPTLDELLADGRIDEGLAAYESPDGDAERFSLAALQMLDGIQQFSAGFNRLGLRPDSPLIGLPMVPVFRPDNRLTAPEPVTPQRVAELFSDLRSSLRRANETLDEMQGDEFGVVVNVSRARLDFDEDGTASAGETLAALGWRLAGTQPDDDQDLVLRFDRADAAWLKGYTHFAIACLEILQAYDWMPVWEQCAHLVFESPDPAPPFQAWAAPEEGFERWADLIATLHEMRLELADRKAWLRAMDELRGMFDASRECWRLVLAETDDDREWLPSPTQTGPRGATITQEQIDAWYVVLDELDAVIDGDKLLPHWRVREGAGIDLAKVAKSPPPMDLVMWIHGGAFLPYLEEGAVSDADSWNDLSRPFGPGFFRFALWSN